MALKTKQVAQFTVSEMGALESARLRLHHKNIAAQGITDEAMAMALDEWALVAACAVPFVPFEQYVTMPVTETRPILEAIEELNSDMVQQFAPPEQAKKKRRG